MKKHITLLVCLILSLILNYSSYAQSIQTLAPNYFCAGIPSIEMYTVGEIDRQLCPEWCWAASSQMILNYHGLYVSQQQIVTKIFGATICQPGSDVNILNALSGWAPDTRGRYSSIYSQAGITNVTDIVNLLAYKWPLLVCMRNGDGSGHAVVLTGIYYSLDQFNNIIVDKVVIRDPWPTNPSRQEMNWTEFANRASDIIKVWVQRL